MYRDRLYRTMGAGVIWLVVIFAALLAVALGVLIARYTPGVRELLILGIGVVVLLAVLVPTDTVLRIGLGAGIASIGLGWRTVSLTPDLTFSVMEGVIWALAVVLVLRSVVRRTPLSLNFSLPLALFLFLVLLTLVRGFVSDTPLDKSIGYGKQLLMLAPFFLVIRNLVPDLRTWQRLIFVAVGVSLYLSVVGVLTFLFPQTFGPLGNLLSAETVEAVNFVRAGFPGWGPLAAWFFVPVFCLVVGFWNSAAGWRAQTIYLLILAIIGAGILISGQRGAWVALLVGVGVFALFNWRRGLIIGAIVGFLIWRIPEQSVAVRLASAFDPALYDTSAADRYNRASAALADIQNHPVFGLGFGVRTWTHSDYLEVAAAMGLAALGLFVLALALTGKRLLWLGFSPDAFTRKLSQGVLAMFAALVIELLSSGFVTLSFTVVVIWFLWAMADQYALVAQSSISHDEITSLDSPPHL